MDPRKLRRLLDTYRDAGVFEVELDDKLQPRRVRFGAALTPVPDEDIEGTDQDWTQGAPMGLEQALQRIRKQYEPKRKAS